MELKNSRDVAIFIKLRRAQLELSQEALAKKTGVSRSWLADVEGGKSTAEIGKVLQVFKALGVQLFAREQEIPETSVIDDILDQHRKSE